MQRFSPWILNAFLFGFLSGCAFDIRGWGDDGNPRIPLTPTALDSGWAPSWGLVQGYWSLDGSGAFGIGVSPGFGTGSCSQSSAGPIYEPGVIGQGIGGLLQATARLNCTGTGIEAIGDKLSFGGWVKVTGGTPVNGDDLVRSLPAGIGWSLQRSNTIHLKLRVDTNAQVNATCGSTSMPALDDSWHHVFYTLNTGNMAVYLDGTMRATCSYLHGTGFANAGPVNFRGLSDDGSTVIDEWAFWHEELTAVDVKSIYDHQSGI